eukprot:TRINITY_DN9558_c0_g1_i2.p1 TRINITY_DN9558_c0_g1~~TRINITY_DN9558_c0_g1_i2.p1  ORF type:complete len:134 (-),score=2.95 TRINITY_DN9558_c0_g1_i2:151-552(-)
MPSHRLHKQQAHDQSPQPHICLPTWNSIDHHPHAPTRPSPNDSPHGLGCLNCFRLEHWPLPCLFWKECINAAGTAATAAIAAGVAASTAAAAAAAQLNVPQSSSCLLKHPGLTPAHSFSSTAFRFPSRQSFSS